MPVARKKEQGVWSIEETEFHINYLELLAAFLAIQTFVKHETNFTVYLQLDSVTATHTSTRREGLGLPLCHSWPNRFGVGAWKERDITHSRSHSGEGEYDSRLRIMGVQGQVGLEAESGTVQNNSTEVWSSGEGSICNQAIDSTPTVLQLETRPRSRSHKCIQAVMERSELRKPTMGSTSPRPDASEDTESQPDPHSTGLEDAGMVPSAPVSPNRLSMSASSRGDNDHTNSHQASTDQGSGSAAGRMAYIRRSCEDRQLSEGATSLLMASWRSKSHSSYNSLFHKWECWCSQRDRNPIHGSVTDVVNYLAELYEAGYSYRSLNSYHSAISLVHEKVDGHSIGQHPMVSRVLKGAFNCRPPKPRYTATCQVVTWLDKQDTHSIPLLALAMKTVILCALSRQCRSAELANLSFKSPSFSPEGVSVSRLVPPKQCQPGRAIKEYLSRILITMAM